MNRGWSDRGSSSLEAILIGVPLFLLAGLILAWGMAGQADGAVSSAARAAARAASLSSTADEAQQAAREAAWQVLASHEQVCVDVEVAIDATGFATPVGQPASVTATVSCTVPLSEVSAPGMPGSRRLSDSFTSALDQYAERGR